MLRFTRKPKVCLNVDMLVDGVSTTIVNFIHRPTFSMEIRLQVMRQRGLMEILGNIIK